MLECAVRIGFQMLFEIYFEWLVNLVQEQVQEQVLKRRWFKNPEQLRDQVDRVFVAASCIFTRCPVDSTRGWFDISFIFLDSY